MDEGIMEAQVNAEQGRTIGAERRMTQEKTGRPTSSGGRRVYMNDGQRNDRHGVG